MRPNASGSECPERLADRGQRAGGEDDGRDAAPLVRDRVDLLRAHGPDRHEEDERDERRVRRAEHPVGRDEPEVEAEVDAAATVARDPVEAGSLRAPRADRDDDEAGEEDARERKRRDRPLRRPVAGLASEPVHEPRREQAQRERRPGGDQQEVGEDIRVGALRLVLVLDRVGERRPRDLEGGEEEHHRRGDLGGERVLPELGEPERAVEELAEHQPVAEVRDPHRERGAHERDAEAVHRAQELPVPLEAELLRAVDEEDGPHDERPAQVPDDDPERPLVLDDDEEHGQPHGDGDVREGRDRERDRPLLRPEEVGHLRVVDVDPEEDGGRDDETRAAALQTRGVSGRDAEQAGDRLRERDADDERDRRVGQLRPEDGADQAAPVVGILVEEVEADEAEVRAAANEDDAHRHRRHEELDAAVIARRDVARVERQHEDGEEARHEAADAIDRRVAGQFEELGGEGAVPTRSRWALASLASWARSVLPGR